MVQQKTENLVKQLDPGSVNLVQAPEPVRAPVIPLPTRHVTKVIKKARRIKPSWFRKHGLIISLFLCVLLPGVLGSIYFIAIASDRYAAGAGFSVRSVDSGPSGADFLGALSGISSATSTTSDSYIIVKYLQSAELVEKLIKDADFLKAYSGDNVDWFYRADPSEPIEDLVDYWSWMINVSYDSTSDLIEFEVQAFTAEDAGKMADLITEYAQNLINRLSAEARNDSVKFAKKEVAAAEVRLRFAREELRKFRAVSSSLDPEALAAAQVEITTSLETQIIEQRARLNTLRQGLSEDASSVRETKKLIKSLESELVAKQSQISKSNEDQNLAEVLANYERLLLEQEFAQQAYTVTLASLESARSEADRQQRFLAVFKQPTSPSSAIYPYRILSSIITFIIAFLLWSVGLFLFYSIRDHLR